MVELGPDTENNAFACMLAELVRQNLEDDPTKRSLMNRLFGRLAMVAEDLAISATLCFQNGKLTMHSGIVGIPDVTLRAQSGDILRLSNLDGSAWFGLPDIRTKETRELARAFWKGRIKIYGALPNLPFLLRVTRLMSIAKSPNGSSL